MAALVTPDYHCMKDTEQEPHMGSYSRRAQDVVSHRLSSKVEGTFFYPAKDSWKYRDMYTHKYSHTCTCISKHIDIHTCQKESLCVISRAPLKVSGRGEENAVQTQTRNVERPFRRKAIRDTETNSGSAAVSRLIATELKWLASLLPVGTWESPYLYQLMVRVSLE